MRIIFGLAHALDQVVTVTCSWLAVRERPNVNRGPSGVHEILDGRVAVFDIKCTKDKPAEVITATEIFFPGLGVVGRASLQFFLFEIRELKPQAFENSLGDAVLDS